MTNDERIEKLEIQLIRAKQFDRYLIACIVLSLGIWFTIRILSPETTWGQSGAKILRANSLILEDENGKTRATLSVSKRGVHLKLMDENEILRMGLSVDREMGPAIMLGDEKGRQRVTLAVLQGETALLLADEKGKMRVLMSGSESGPGLALRDENGKTCVDLSADEYGPSLVLANENATNAARLQYLKGMGPSLELMDDSGKPRTGLRYLKGMGAGLVLMDDNGKQIWSAP